MAQKSSDISIKASKVEDFKGCADQEFNGHCLCFTQIFPFNMKLTLCGLKEHKKPTCPSPALLLAKAATEINCLFK